MEKLCLLIANGFINEIRIKYSHLYCFMAEFNNIKAQQIWYISKILMMKTFLNETLTYLMNPIYYKNNKINQWIQWIFYKPQKSRKHLSHCVNELLYFQCYAVVNLIRFLFILVLVNLVLQLKKILTEISKFKI